MHFVAQVDVTAPHLRQLLGRRVLLGTLQRLRNATRHVDTWFDSRSLALPYVTLGGGIAQGHKGRSTAFNVLTSYVEATTRVKF
jgi:hypothetical protein